MNRPLSFDLIVIGAGAAGSSIASGAAGRGFSVALIEEHKVGGTCLNVGCDPTKTLIRSAEIAHLARTSGRFGIEIPEPRIDWPSIRDRVHTVIDTIRGGDGDQNLRDLGITLIKEHGQFIDRDHVMAGDQKITADRFLIATGASQRIPDIEGLSDIGFITYNNLLDLGELPASLVIVGGGVVAVEFAQMLARLGVEVTMTGSRSQILPREEPALSEALLDVLKAEGVRWVPGVRITRAMSRDGAKVVTGRQEDGAAIELEAGEIMVATGRTANIDRLGLNDAGIATSSRGIVVDATLRTTNPQVYAVGDVTGIYPFTHVADYQARVAEHNVLAEGAPQKADYRVVPWVTFSDPELARVGLTEDEARAGGYDIASVTVPFADLPRAMTLDERHGMVKLVVDRQERKVLGGHVLGARAGELIGEIAVVMEQGLPVDAIAATIHPYPTMSEAVFWAAYQMVTEVLTESSDRYTPDPTHAAGERRR